MTRFEPSACGGLRVALANVEVMLRWSGAMWLEGERLMLWWYDGIRVFDGTPLPEPKK